MRPHLVIVGPTASGKSALALAIATRMGASARAEIVSADSMAVYRGMDIGTAKPAAAERALVPHHLVDLVDPNEDYSVARFQKDAASALATIESAGAHAIVVGGTGLYVDAMVDALSIPGRWDEVRTELETALASGLPVAELHDRLVRLDPVAAARMEPTNARRIVRALEVTLGSGTPFSAFGPGLQDARTQRDHGRFFLAGLQLPREVLAERIAARYEDQLERGFLEEVAGLAARYGEGLSRTAAQALGYKELAAHLRGDITLEDALAQALRRTVAFAKRQERWFRRDPRIRWFPAQTDGLADLVLQDWRRS